MHDVMHDVRTIVWLRWKQFRDDLVYGLRLLGYESGERIYALYLAALLAFWAFAIVSYSLDQAIHLGRAISYDTLSGGLEIIPFIVLIGQVWVLLNALRTSPLKLSFPDISYVATSPINPVGIVLPDFLRQTLIRVLLVLPFTLLFLTILGGKAIGGVNPLGEIVLFSLRGLLVGTVIVILTGALSWLLGMQRVIYPAIRRIPGLWLLPLLLLLAAVVAPDFVLYPGHLLVLSAFEPLPLAVWGFLIGTTAVTIAGMLFFSQFINITQVIDESHVFARLNELGVMAWRQIDLQMRIRMESTQKGRQPWLRLPKNLQGGQAIVARAALSYIRHPILLLTSALRGAAMTFAVVLIIRAGVPIQLVAAWILVVALLPPIDLLYVYRDDVEEMFLRQFLPLDGFLLLLADALLPLIALCAGGMAVWVASAPNLDVVLIGCMMIIVVALIQALGGARGAAKGEKALQTRLISLVISYGAIAIGYAAGGLTGLLFVSVFVLMVLIGLVTQEA